MLPRNFRAISIALAAAALCAACMALTPIQACEQGIAAYRDTFDWQFPPYAIMKTEVWMQCGVAVQPAKEAAK
jgi:hypothetical protein